MSESQNKSLKDSAPTGSMKNKGKNTLTEKEPVSAKRIVYLLLPLLSIALIVLGWIYLSGRRPDMLPAPVDCWHRMIKLFTNPVNNQNLFGHIWSSLKRVLTALVIAWVLGIAFGVLIGWNQRAKALFGSIFELIRPIPPIAWIPLISMWFGLGEFSKVLIVFIGTFTPVVINTCVGISMVEQQYLYVGQIFRANQRQALFDIAIPSALPAIFAGIRSSTSAGWMVVLAAEMLGAKTGLGLLITRGMESDDTALIMVSIVTIGIIGALLAAVTSYIERRACPWRTDQ